MSKKILIIGGTGIIGKATVAKALEAGFEVTTIGRGQEDSLPKEVNQVITDKSNQEEYQLIAKKLNSQNEWDIVFDVYNLGQNDAEQTYQNFKNNAKHFIVISTTLVYDRSEPNTEPIKSSHPLAELGTMGGYADHKIELEHFWQSVKDVPWTILRPYHIVGSYSLLGCVPDENRDPRLLDKIKNNESLQLCDGGESEFNFIYPQDIAEIATLAGNNPKTFGKAYNTVNPEIIKAKDYFAGIGKVLNREVKIENKPLEEIWREDRGWQLTTLPHIYDISDLQKDIGFTPSIPLEQAMKEAIENYPTGEQELSEIAIHKRMTMEPRPKPIKWLISKEGVSEQVGERKIK